MSAEPRRLSRITVFAIVQFALYPEICAKCVLRLNVCNAKYHQQFLGLILTCIQDRRVESMYPVTNTTVGTVLLARKKIPILCH